MFSKKVKFLYAVASVVLATSIAVESYAAPTAGICNISYDEEVEDEEHDEPVATTPFSGISLKMNEILSLGDSIAKANLEAKQAARVAAYDYTNIAIAQVDNFVYIRTIPSTEGDIVGKLYNKSAATVLNEVDGWYEIESGDCKGYVSAEYVVVGDPELAKACSTRYATCETDTLFVRSGPSTDYAIIGYIARGDDVVVVDESIEDSGWVKAICEEVEGYICLEYVSLSTDFVKAESKEAEERRLAKEAEEREAARKAAEKATKKNSSSSSSSGSNVDAQGRPIGNSGFSYSMPAEGASSSVITFASQFVGGPYVWGGTSLTNGCDCSGFVMSVYKNFGVSLPHSSKALRSVGYGVSIDQMQPGDIVCYSGHCGLYAGNGMLLNASSRRTGIIYNSVYYAPILAVRRIF